MSSPKTPAIFYLLPEDTGGDAVPILQHLLEAMFNQLQPAWRLIINPIYRPTPETVRNMSRQDQWKARSRPHAQDYAAFIATRLLLKEFVVVSMDSDEPWSKCKGAAPCQNMRQFDELVVTRVKAHLAQRNMPEAFSHLLCIVPYHNRESWVFQNFAEAERILSENPRHSHLWKALTDTFGTDRALLDDEAFLKRDFEPLAKVSLRMVSRSWPSAEVYRLGASFTRGVEDLRKSDALLSLLSL